jgi:hypothetical protein
MHGQGEARAVRLDDRRPNEGLAGGVQDIQIEVGTLEKRSQLDFDAQPSPITERRHRQLTQSDLVAWPRHVFGINEIEVHSGPRLAFP